MSTNYSKAAVSGNAAPAAIKPLREATRGPIAWPQGKRFAFTIVDDTDLSTVANTKPVYDLLLDNGIVTTKTVWPLAVAAPKPISGGHSLEHPEYRDWILRLQSKGVEIAFHGAADESSTRQRTILGLEYFRKILGNYPNVHSTHSGQKEALYWGSARFDPPLSWIYSLLRRRHRADVYSGTDISSPFFWGDWAQISPKYVRNLVFDDINTLKMDPLMPYHDARRPFVQSWFSSSYGSSPNAFCRLISEANQDRLESEGGACIVYTHLGSGFYPLRDDFKRLVRRLGAKSGWFVPATNLLDYLAARRGLQSTSAHPLAFQKMQWNWLLRQGFCKLNKRAH